MQRAPHHQDRVYRCPCCRHVTLHDRGAGGVCPVCAWVDDGRDDEDIALVLDGPNGAMTLAEARRTFETCGACDPARTGDTRPPTAAEIIGRWPLAEEVAAAAKALDAAGRFHRWWPSSIPAYPDLDPIGKEEFEEIVVSLLQAAARVRRGQRQQG
jgi:hypothetical protein